MDRAKAFVEQQEVRPGRSAADDGQPNWIFVAPSGRAQRAPRSLHEIAEDFSLPGTATRTGQVPRAGTLIPTELVIRSPSAGGLTFSLPFDLASQGVVLDDSYYVLPRLQFAPDGRQVYGWFGFTFAAEVASGKLRLLADGGIPGSLSPDGDAVASLDKEVTLRITKTDGSRVALARLPTRASWSGLAWMDKETLAVLGQPTAEGEAPLHVFRADGTRLRSHPLSLPGGTRGEAMHGQLAISPDGKFLVISYGESVYFLDRDFDTLGTWRGGGEQLVQPAFSPDSKQVAFTLMPATKPRTTRRTTGIVFFSPGGTQLFGIAIPAVVQEPSQATVKGDQDPDEAAKRLARKYGCHTCHTEDAFLVGPGYAHFAKKYHLETDAPERLAAKVRNGSGGTWGPVRMPATHVPYPNLEVILDWILSLPDPVEE